MDIDRPHVRQLTEPSEKDLQRVLFILHETISNDTVVKVYTGGSTAALSTYLRLLLDGCVDSGGLFVAWTSPDSREFDAVALWSPPSKDWLPWEEEEFLSQLRQEKKDWITHHAISKYEELYKSAFGAWGYNAGINNWQLKAIAVLQECRGRGLGKALMEVVHRKATASNHKVVVDCHSQIAVRFFHKLGFQHQSVKNFFSLTEPGFAMWCMVWEPGRKE
ncbi:hypothetical protein BJ322DRAFT_263899 [Thelephora terrestris]|uniref:N-acetyltransferase domain-containing protein n=1 Tax=Thelephora terrestris TaxID=56493 RepID=A0A9P6H8B9_9AGAM|nr:hypothetical protein BJ322DRAFT_263899 [Thelephora terrestris]